MDRLKYFKSESNTQGRRGENDVTWLAVGPSVNISFPEHIRIYLSDCLQIVYITPLRGIVVPFGVYELCPTLGSEL